MAAWRYEISLLVLKYFSTLEEKFRISARSCNILYLFCSLQTFSVIFVKSFSNVGIIKKRSLQDRQNGCRF